MAAKKASGMMSNMWAKKAIRGILTYAQGPENSALSHTARELAGTAGIVRWSSSRSAIRTQTAGTHGPIIAAIHTHTASRIILNMIRNMSVWVDWILIRFKGLGELAATIKELAKNKKGEINHGKERQENSKFTIGSKKQRPFRVGFTFKGMQMKTKDHPWLSIYFSIAACETWPTEAAK